MSIDVAIVNYRSATDTLSALGRLAQWPHGRIWLVDNSACEIDMADETSALVNAVADMRSVTLLTPANNLGFGRACNLAFAQSNAELFLLLNPDAHIAPEDVLRLAHALSEQPKLGAVSPKIFWNEQRSFVLPAAFPQTPWHSVALALATHSHRVTRWAANIGLKRAMRHMAEQRLYEVKFLAGAVMLLRRSAVLQAGGLFDPDYFMFFEDSDLSLRLRRAGHRLAMVPQASAVHRYRHKAFKANMMEQSQRQYFRKQHAVFYFLSNGLHWVAPLGRTVTAAEWFKVHESPIATAAEFSRVTGHRPVLAISPSLLMMPAMFRPSLVEARCLDELEWASLEPAAYVALVEGTGHETKTEWVYFRRAEEDRVSSALTS